MERTYLLQYVTQILSSDECHFSNVDNVCYYFILCEIYRTVHEFISTNARSPTLKTPYNGTRVLAVDLSMTLPCQIVLENDKLLELTTERMEEWQR